MAAVPILEIVPAVGAGFAEATIVVNSAPHGGYVDAAPRAGVAAVDTFFLESLEWSDDADDFPLMFSFSVAYGQVRARDRGKFRRAVYRYNDAGFLL